MEQWLVPELDKKRGQSVQPQPEGVGPEIVWRAMGCARSSLVLAALGTMLPRSADVLPLLKMNFKVKLWRLLKGGGGEGGKKLTTWFNHVVDSLPETR